MALSRLSSVGIQSPKATGAYRFHSSSNEEKAAMAELALPSSSAPSQ